MSRNNTNNNMEPESDWRSGLGYSSSVQSATPRGAGHPGSGGGRSDNNSNPVYNSVDEWPNGHQHSTMSHSHQSSVHSYQSQHEHYHHHYQPPAQPPPGGYSYYNQYYPQYGGYPPYPPAYPSSSYPYPQEYHQPYQYPPVPYPDPEASHHQSGRPSRETIAGAEYLPPPPRKARTDSSTFADDNHLFVREHGNVTGFGKATTSRKICIDLDDIDSPPSTNVKEAEDDDDGFEFEEIDYSITNGNAISSSPPPSEIPVPSVPENPPVNGLDINHPVSDGPKKRVRFAEQVSFHEPSVSQSQTPVPKDQPVKSGSLNGETNSNGSKKRVTFDVPHSMVPLDEVLSDLSSRKSSSRSSPAKSRKVVEDNIRYKRKRPTREADDNEGDLVEFLGRTNSRVSSRCYAKAKSPLKGYSKDGDDSSTLSSASEDKDKVTNVPVPSQSISPGCSPQKIHKQVSRVHQKETESGKPTTHDDETIRPASVENIDSPPSPAPALPDIGSSETMPPDSSSSYAELERALAALHSESESPLPESTGNIGAENANLEDVNSKSPLPESTGNIEKENADIEDVNSKSTLPESTVNIEKENVDIVTVNSEPIIHESPGNIEEECEDIVVDVMNCEEIQSPENIEEEGEDVVDVMNFETIQSSENEEEEGEDMIDVMNCEAIQSPESITLQGSATADIANIETEQSMDVEDVSDCDDNDESGENVFDIRIRTDIFEDDVSDG